MTTAADIASMTGFARADGQGEGFSWVVEAKSVNGRSLDLRCRTPAGFESVESLARAELSRRFKRGSISLSVTLTRTGGSPQIRINRELLDQLLALARELGAGAPPRFDALLAVRGVVEPVEDNDPEVRRRLEVKVGEAALLALDRLAVARLDEGRRLAAVLTGHLDLIARLTGDAGAVASTQPAALRERLRQQVTALLDAVPGLPEERLAQEAALLATRADIREELDRLAGHAEAARALLAEGGAVGRRLDFLCQEFTREANTVCSKSADLELTRIGLALKAAVEQLREQVQNIE